MAMAPMEVQRFAAAVLTVIVAVLAAVNWSPRTTVLGFAVFIAASVAPLMDGRLEGMASLNGGVKLTLARCGREDRS